LSTTPTAQTKARARLLKRRYNRIVRFAALVLAQSWWFEIFLPSIGLGNLAAHGRVRRMRKIARRFRHLALQLTGLMIKVGQFISSRLDVLPIEITRELEGLQDEVAPEPFHLVRAQIESSLGMTLEDAFAAFQEAPIAAASLGQAHPAVLPSALSATGEPQAVVVKVLRPGIEEIVEVDLRALRKVGVWLSRVKLISRRADAPALVEEFATTTLQEIDYLNEARNLEQFAANFAADPYVAVPEIVWERSALRVLTLTNVASYKISDAVGLAAIGIDPNAVAAEFARVTFEQIFVHGFFHADPHPGNVFVTPSPLTAGGFQLTFIDFGMMGVLSAEQQANLRRFIFAVVSRDAQGWVAAVERLHLLLPSADTVQLEIAIDALFKRFGGVGVADIVNTDPREFRDFALQFGDLVRTLPFQVPENFLFLVRAISLVSGVTSSLNRNFNMWDALEPFARSLLQSGSGGFAGTVAREALDALNILVRLPKRFDATLSRLERGELSIRNPELEKRVGRVERTQSRVALAIYTVALLGAGVYLRAHGDGLGNLLLIGALVPAGVAFVTSRIP